MKHSYTEEQKEKGVLVEIDLTRELCIADKVRINLGDYVVKEENGETYLVKKKPTYPNTFDECCKVLGSDPSRIIVLSNRQDLIHEEEKHCREMYDLYQLLICRDAYWKSAGELMGLDKPWEPSYIEESFEEGSPIKYVIFYNGAYIAKERKASHYFLSFPTAEMRDAFYDNFKDLIEKCRELL